MMIPITLATFLKLTTKMKVVLVMIMKWVPTLFDGELLETEINDSNEEMNDEVYLSKRHRSN